MDRVLLGFGLILAVVVVFILVRFALAWRRTRGTRIVVCPETDVEEAIERANRYREAGADWIFVEALTTREEFTEVAAAVDAPLIANMTEFGKSPLLSVQTLDALGYRAVLFPVTLLRIAAAAQQRGLEFR